MSDSLLYELHDHIAILTINRQEYCNALDSLTLNKLAEKIKEINFNKSIRVLIITGMGEKAFCSGADLKERKSMSPDQVREYIYTVRNTFSDIEKLSIPVICAVNGLALGGGTELALVCDIRISTEKAIFGLTEVTLGTIPGAGGTQRLPRIVGSAKAKELIYIGKKISSQEALAIGLINEITATSVKALALKIATTIAENAPLAIQQAKYSINHGLEVDLHTGLALETKNYEAIIPTKDRLEGLKAFQEKRKPVYIGE